MSRPKTGLASEPWSFLLDIGLGDGNWTLFWEVASLQPWVLASTLWLFQYWSVFSPGGSASLYYPGTESATSMVLSRTQFILLASAFLAFLSRWVASFCLTAARTSGMDSCVPFLSQLWQFAYLSPCCLDLCFSSLLSYRKLLLPVVDYLYCCSTV